MASIPGARFDLTGASGSQGLLSPKSGWRSYVFPRGAYAAQDSTGTLITFDSADAASRFSANDWVQSGLSTDNIRQVSAVGGDSMSVSGAAVTVSENDRIFLIGTTQPTVTGGSATYTTPNTLIRQRADDAATLYSNSMITSDSNGLIQFFGTPALYDVMIQDGNQSNQGFIAELELGTVQGISLTGAITFGATVTVSGTLIGAAGVSFEGPSSFGTTVTMHGTLGVTGDVALAGALDVSSTALIGATLTTNGALGVTGWATFGTSITANGALGVTGWATFGSTVTMAGALGVTGTATVDGFATFGDSVSIAGNITAGGGFPARSYIGPWLLLSHPSAGTTGNLSLDITASFLTDIVMTRPGSVTGIAIRTTQTILSNSMIFTVMKNGVATGVTTGMDTAFDEVNSNTVAAEGTTFSANDFFAVDVFNSNPVLTPTNADFIVSVEILTG